MPATKALALLFPALCCVAAKTIVGIDLGTTFCSVAVYKQGRVDVIANEFGYRVTPSVVSFSGKETLVGESAADRLIKYPESTVFDSKRMLGKDFRQPELQEDIKLWPFPVINQKGKPRIVMQVDGKSKKFQPEEISTLVLQKMKLVAEKYLGETITEAVITVPAPFNDAQRKATRNAASAAGLKVFRMINEPTAAAIAYGVFNQEETNDSARVVVVFDFGGGTLDVSLLLVTNMHFKVISSHGDAHLGGQDLDNNVVRYLFEKFQEMHPNEQGASKDSKAKSKMKKAAEKAKRSLTTQEITDIEIDALYKGKDFSTKLTRAEFEHLNEALFARVTKPCAAVLKDAELLPSDVDTVLMVGGSSRIPKVQELVKKYFGQNPHFSQQINPDEAIAQGAAIIAGMSDSDQIPIEVLDITSLTLGVEISGGFMVTVIKPNTPLPVNNTRTFSTAHDDQTSVDIKVFQGSNELTANNELIGKFELTGIPPKPAKSVKIYISLMLDANGILQVSARSCFENDKCVKNQIKIDAFEQVMHTKLQTNQQPTQNPSSYSSSWSWIWICACFVVAWHLFWRR